MRLVVTILALSFISLGCYNKEFNEPGRVEHKKQPTERIYEAGFDRTWASVQKVLGRFPVQKKGVEQAGTKAYLVTDWIAGKSDVLYSGFDRSRIPYTIRYQLYVYLVGGKGRTKVSIRNVEQYKDDVISAGTDFSGSVNTWIRTESSTLKEAQLLEEIQRTINDRGFTPQ